MAETARDWMESLPAVVRDRRAALLLLRYGPPSGGGGGSLCGGDHSDPTAARALSDEAARVRLRETDAALDEADARFAGLRALCGDRAEPVRCHYVCEQTWAEVAAGWGVCERTLRGWRDQLCDTADALGWARVKEGRGAAEL